jgi:peptide methionine sulfoxide reductase msrA/msrB
MIMKLTFILLSIAVFFGFIAYITSKKIKHKLDNVKEIKIMGADKLTEEEKAVIVDKGTEKPFTGKYYDFFKSGIYTCRKCGAALYRSDDKFKSGCGWPAFEDEIKGAVKRTRDADGLRTEITCSNCGAHLGHVFVGEKLTPMDTRHCVNSISMKFAPVDSPEVRRAIFAGGCFWGVEHLMSEAPGVITAISGYTGGNKDYPSYKEVCSGKTGHAEAVEVIYNPKKTNFEKLAKYFLEIHDPTQVNRQGPDRGSQYRSVIFYLGENQKKTAEKLITILKNKGLKVATKVEKAGRFWPAEDYHQDYYDRKGTSPYCHKYIKRF